MKHACCLAVIVGCRDKCNEVCAAIKTMSLIQLNLLFTTI